MLSDGIRSCDICGEEIPKGSKFAVRTVARESAKTVRATLGLDPLTSDVLWRENVDGSISLDVCTLCYVSMGPDAEKMVH